jgi:hypothetical protein
MDFNVIPGVNSNDLQQFVDGVNTREEAAN